MKCAAEETCCGLQCIDLQSDRLNCGACGNRCPSTSDRCIDGECVPFICPAGAHHCDDPTSECNGQIGCRCLSRSSNGETICAGLRCGSGCDSDADCASLAPLATAADAATPAAATPTAASGDVAGLVDIGGRSLYLECRGQGSPTVILESGAYGRGDVWSRDLEQPAGERTMVLPGVAQFTRVCAYDRPGTIGDVNPSLDPYGPLFYPSRSDPVPQPRTTQDMVDDLHALLAAAAVPGPYVLVGHSSGGLVARLYASEYPDEVVGMVLLDSTHEDVWLRFQEALTPEQWVVFEDITVNQKTKREAYPEVELWYTAPLADDATTGQVRQAMKDAPLHPMPLVVLAHGIPFGDAFPGWPSEKMEAIMSALQEELAQRIPAARLAVASESGHNIHQDQPELVIDAVRDAVAAVRDPGTWTSAPATPDA